MLVYKRPVVAPSNVNKWLVSTCWDNIPNSYKMYYLKALVIMAMALLCVYDLFAHLETNLNEPNKHEIIFKIKN